MLENFKNLYIFKSKSKKKWRFGQGKKVKILKYSGLSDYQKLNKYRKWLLKDDRFSYISEGRQRIFLEHSKI